MKVGDLIECPAGIGLITKADTVQHGGYVFVFFLLGWGDVAVYCDSLKVISEYSPVGER